MSHSQDYRKYLENAIAYRGLKNMRVTQYSLSYERRTNQFYKGFIVFEREITIDEKLLVMDCLSNLFGGAIVEGLRRGRIVEFWNPALVERC